MRLLDRYLLRELLVPLGFCLGGFFIFWVSSDLFTELRSLQKGDLNWLDIVELYLVRTPEFLGVVLPVALLLALLYTLTHHARYHEITAIRAAGISLWRLSAPYFGVGFCCSLLLLASNELWAPRSAGLEDAIKQRRVPSSAVTLGPGQVQHLGFSNARDGRVWQIGMYDANTREMRQPQVIWDRPDGARVWIKADRGIHTNGVWMFMKVGVYRENPNNEPPLIPLVLTNVMVFPEFGETPEMIRSEMRIARGLSLRKSARKTDLPISDILDYLRLHPTLKPEDAAWLFTKLHGRLAMPWTCLVVVLMAIPFGAASGRRNVYAGVASSIVLCFGYFVLQQLCLALGAGGQLPPWMAGWLPNIAFAVTGIVLTLRVR